MGRGEVVEGKWRQLYLDNNKKERKKKKKERKLRQIDEQTGQAIYSQVQMVTRVKGRGKTGETRPHPQGNLSSLAFPPWGSHLRPPTMFQLQAKTSSKTRWATPEPTATTRLPGLALLKGCTWRADEYSTEAFPRPPLRFLPARRR